MSKPSVKKLLLLTMHALILAGAVIVYALVLSSFIEIARRNAFVRYSPQLIAVFIIAGAACIIAAIDTVFVFINKKRKITSIMAGVCVAALFVFLILSLIIYGTGIIFAETRVYLPVMCALIAASVLLGFFVSEKILKKDVGQDNNH